ncbi:UDP-N-acetylmuramoyl-L-alanine--D-glutamate ligase [Gemmatimonas sp.]|jgi:UDP-N-acetylmuramoylalanine--D-glutamate ligase|uniref:UDP-N-acetylmuramoyl-L-alanine--D-glutamate ligase n=1 Tax=Gemmatimonas sp. TaxID=1962908 RepID=UPI0037C00EE4
MSNTPQEVASLVARRLAERTGEFAVIGLGRSGVAAARLLRKAGVSVYASDAGTSDSMRTAAAALEREGASVDVGMHNLERIAHAAAVVVSPGVPPTAPSLRTARDAGIPIVSEVEVALRLTPALRYIAITGTNGKTTTTAMVGHLLRALGLDAVDVGNIGTPVSEIALHEPAPTWAALEISSFQLHDTPGILPDVGVLTTLSPDHLDRYEGVAEYYADKKRMFVNATLPSRWVTTADNMDVHELIRGVPGQWYHFSTKRTDVDAWFDRASGQLVVMGAPLMARDDLALAGDHNVANALCALLCVMVADDAHRTPEARATLATALRTFRALAHRLEPVSNRGGITWLNDSKATNVASTQVAIAGMTTPTVVLLGGRHKGEPYTALAAELRRTARAVVAYGEAGPLVHADLAPLLGADVPVHLVPAGTPFEGVLRVARDQARTGDAILLSPACSSYDMFRNYEERGREFARLAEALG